MLHFSTNKYTVIINILILFFWWLCIIPNYTPWVILVVQWWIHILVISMGQPCLLWSHQWLRHSICIHGPRLTCSWTSEDSWRIPCVLFDKPISQAAHSPWLHRRSQVWAGVSWQFRCRRIAWIGCWTIYSSKEPVKRSIHPMEPANWKDPGNRKFKKRTGAKLKEFVSSLLAICFMQDFFETVWHFQPNVQHALESQVHSPAWTAGQCALRTCWEPVSQYHRNHTTFTSPCEWIEFGTPKLDGWNSKYKASFWFRRNPKIRPAPLAPSAESEVGRNCNAGKNVVPRTNLLHQNGLGQRQLWLNCPILSSRDLTLGDTKSWETDQLPSVFYANCRNHRICTGFFKHKRPWNQRALGF